MTSERRSRGWRVLAWIAGLFVLGLAGVCCFSAGMFFGVTAERKQAAGKAAAALPELFVYERDVEYGVGGGLPLVLDLARPKSGEGPFPAVVCIHGGGWRGGDKNSFTAFTQTLAARGYVAVTVKYRFAPAHAFPAQVEDVKCAVRYLRANAEKLKIDPERIGAMGGSAGGHLALMLGTTEATHGLEGSGGHEGFSSRVQAVGSIAGPTDLSQTFPAAVGGMLKDFVGGMPQEKAETYAAASPITYLTPDDPPVLLIHGTQDELVPYAQAASLLEACQRIGIEARLITIEGGAHGYGGPPEAWHAANEQLIQFFDQHLKYKAKATVDAAGD